MRVCGIEIICMVLVWLNGRMVENILGIIIEIKRMEMVYLNGKMGRNMLGNGKMGNSMVKEYLLVRKGKLKEGYGIKGKELNGYD